MKLFFFIVTFLIFTNNYCQSRAIETTGDITQLALPIGAGIATLIIEDKEGTHQLLKSYGTTFAVTFALKFIINKERPERNGRHAFPSGHTASAFSGASFIQRRYGWAYGIPAYALATFTGFSRIHAKKHDGWDVLAGAIVGIGSTYLFTSKYEQKNISLTFDKDEDTYLIGFKYEF